MIARGGRYEGAWDNDKMHGFGTYTWAYGIYTGEWCGGKRGGQGIMAYNNGDRCVRHAGGCAGG